MNNDIRFLYIQARIEEIHKVESNENSKYRLKMIKSLLQNVEQYITIWWLKG